MNAPLRMGMIGGGAGAFIGPVHRMAAELDGRARLVAGVFSGDPGRSREAAARYGIDPERAYPDQATMIATEAGRRDGMQFVAIVTPNHLHVPAARAALAAGLDVMSEKPAGISLAETVTLRKAVEDSGRVFGLAHAYTGYAMVRQARAMIAAGAIGSVRKVAVDYSQGWLAAPNASRQAAWRGDPKQSGAGGCIADIGVHAFNIAEYVTGLSVSEICADLSQMVAGRALDDDANVLLRFADGSRGLLQASQIAAGKRNGLCLRVWGDTGGFAWNQETPDRLSWEEQGQPVRTLHAGEPYLHADARDASRLPPGHPEGFIEAFANLYRAFADAIAGERELVDRLLPGIDAGVRGMAFIEAAIASSAARRWVAVAA